MANSETINYPDFTMEMSINMSPCIVSGCIERLADDRELQLHLASTHGMTEIEIETALLEEKALNGGAFWISGYGDEDEDFCSQEWCYAKDNETFDDLIELVNNDDEEKEEEEEEEEGG